MTEWNPQNDAWLSGFAAGESYFRLNAQGSGALCGFRPGFVIELRADEAGILYRLAESFGGTVRVRPAQKNNAHPTLSWNVESKADLASLVAYFECFPLRAKKQAEFIVWAEAVRLYIERGYRAEGLATLAAEIRALRLFVAPGVEPVAQVTRKEVAELAGVSERAVKRAFSADVTGISDETRARIEDAARTLGYEGKRQRPRLRLVS